MLLVGTEAGLVDKGILEGLGCVLSSIWGQEENTLQCGVDPPSSAELPAFASVPI